MSSKTSASRTLFPVNNGATGPFNSQIEDSRHGEGTRRHSHFLTRRPLTLESRASFGSIEDSDDQMTIVGLRSSLNRTDRGSVSSSDSLHFLPPISTNQSTSSGGTSAFEPEVLNLPLLYHSSYPVNHDANYKDRGTIRRSYDIEEGAIPVVVTPIPHTDRDDKELHDIDDVYDLNQRTSTEYDFYGGRISNISDDSCGISPFPPVEKKELDKHKLLNEEAEKNNKKTRPDPTNSDYLKRLKLVRKPLPQLKIKEKKVKTVLKRMQTKGKFVQNQDIFPEKEETSPPPKPVEKPSKSTKLIIGFRYSFAVEEYYRGKLSNLASFAPLVESNSDQSEHDNEVVNGWVVKSVGAKALNLSARTLPSCNPIELRMRVQQARLRRISDKLPSSRGSMTSRSYLKSNLGFSTLHHIEEDHEPKQQSPTGREIEHNEDTHDSPGVASDKRGSESVDTSRATRKSPSRTISLSLPTLTIEE